MFQIVVLGGSSVASPELISALLSHAHECPLRVILVGRDENKLAHVGTICAQLASSAPNLRVEWTTDLARALDGADFVLNQIRVGGLAARAFDESFPHQFDIPGEETVGPGGFANALRTIPVCVDYARLVEQYAPDAWFINLTNPAGMIQRALAQTTTRRVVSVCDSPVTLMEQVARLLNVPYAELKFDYVGMLHFGWIVGVRHNGVDVMPRALENLAQLPGLVADARLVQAMGAIPHPYLNYFFAPEKMLARQRAKGHTRAEELQTLETELLNAYETGDTSLVKKRAAVWYEKIIVPVILALLRGGEFVVNARNTSSASWLPSDTIVETFCEINARQPLGAEIKPRPFAPTPRDVQAMLQVNAAYEALVVDAILNDSYDMAWRALRLNPLLTNAAQAREILDLVWATRGYP
jgi:6-phospho-beta-glucosidase